MFGGCATHWVADRRLEPRSRELYAMLLRLRVMPPWLACTAEFAGGSASAESSTGQ
jgi:hypothetical protein